MEMLTGGGIKHAPALAALQIGDAVQRSGVSPKMIGYYESVEQSQGARPRAARRLRD